MQAVMSMEEEGTLAAGVVPPSTITWREPVELEVGRPAGAGQQRDAEALPRRQNGDSPRGSEASAHGAGHLSDGDTPAGKVTARTRLLSGGALLTASSPSLTGRDPDQTMANFTETALIIGRQARLQEKPPAVAVGVGTGTGTGSDPVLAHSVSAEGGVPGSPQVSRQSIRSRARPRRVEEPSPFLSVDNLPVEKVVVESKQHTKSRQSHDSRRQTTPGKKRPDPLLNGVGRKTKSPPQSAYTPPAPARSPSRPQSRATPNNTPYNYNSFFTHKSSAFLAGPPNLWSMGNRYWPQHGMPNDRQRLAPLPQALAAEALAPRPNAQVSQPFKQDTDNPVPLDRPVSPSQDLKERTIYALREVTRALNRPQSPPQSRRGGRLLKGRLKPLHTFKLAGPSMDSCKGVQPEEADYGPSDSRMLQRKRELLSMLPPDIFQPRPTTEESVHRTSVVSQLSTDRDKELDDVIGRMQEDGEFQMSSQLLSEEHMPPNSLASLSDEQVSFLQEALIRQRDVPGPPLGQTRDDGSDGRSQVPQISEAYGTSYESLGKTEEAAGDASPSPRESVGATTPGERAEPERVGAAGEEVMRGSMSDYMNEGGAARELSDMVQRVTNSAKRSVAVGEEGSGSAGRSYFSEEGTVRSESPSGTSRTGSGTTLPSSRRRRLLHRRTSSVSEAEMDQASWEMTDGAVSEDGLGEDSSVGRGVEGQEGQGTDNRGDLSSLGKAGLADPLKDPSPDGPPTPSNADLSADPPSSDQTSSDTNPSVTSDTSATRPDSAPLAGDSPASSANINRDSLPGRDSQTQLEPDSNQNRVPEDSESNEVRTETCRSEADHATSRDAKEAEVDEGKSDRRAASVHGESFTSFDVLTGPAEDGSENPSSNGEDGLPIAKPSAGSVPVVQIEVTGPESEIASEPPESLSGVDAEVDKPSVDDQVARTPASSEIIKADGSIDAKPVQDASQCNGDHKDPTIKDENENLQNKEEDGNEAQEESSSDHCHSNTKRGNDDDEDGSPGGSHGNGGSPANGNGGGSGSTGGGGSSGSAATAPSPGTESQGTQRHHQAVPTEDGDQERDAAFWEDDDGIPDIDEAVLFCGICGLDEDTCLCPHSAFRERLNPRENRGIAVQSASAADDHRGPPQAHPRSSSARGSSEAWRGDGQTEEEWIQRHLVLEYRALIEGSVSQGCLSQELGTARDGDAFHALLQGKGVKPASRPPSAKRRPPTSSSSASAFELRDDHGVGQSGAPLESRDCGMGQSGGSGAREEAMGDSGCWSEAAGGLAATRNGTLLNGDVKEGPHQPRPASSSLEVVAKPVVKPRQGSVSKMPPGPIPAPLCFKINARPPPGHLYYFAYGADMIANRVSSYIGREVDQRLWGVLFGFQLMFNKRGADLEAGGFPNIVFSPGRSVEGCVYLITGEELKRLDRHIGCPKFYSKAMFPVWMTNCREAESLGLAQYCIPALTYVAQDQWTLTPEETQQIESDYSVGQCLKGSDLLSPAYVQHIATLRVH